MRARFVRASNNARLPHRRQGQRTDRRRCRGPAGQVLARLDPVDTALSAGAADAQRQLAEAESARFRELKAKNFVSQAALDSRETSLKAAAAQADLSRATSRPTPC